MAAVKAIFDPGNVFNPGVLVDPAPLDADLRVPQARPLRTGLGFAYPHDGGDLSVAVHRCVGVGKCRADTTASGGSCARRTWPRGTRRTPPAAARACCRSSRTARWSRTSARRRWPTRSTCACRARAARRTARPGWTWRPTRPRCCTSGTGAGRVRRPTTRWAGCPAGLGWPRTRRDWRTPRCATRRWPAWPSGWAESTPAARCRSSPRRASARGSPAVPPGPGLRCCCGWTRSPTTSPPRSARPPCGCSRRPATRWKSPASPCAAA